jgi:hypothetical protein
MKIQDLHGKVEKCNRCTNADPAKPMSCSLCYCRGYVAECLQCSGKGMIEEPVVGGAKGTMTATCPSCGGARCFGVNKPADWDQTHPEAIPQPDGDSAPVEAAGDRPAVPVYPDAKAALQADPKGWQTPPLRPSGNAAA